MLPPDALVKQGVPELPCIGDGRQSGTSASPSILNASPEAAVGGPLALVRTGDRIRVSVENRTLDLLVDEAELEKRRAELPETSVPVHARGYQKLYYDSVLQADGGCDFDFLRDPSLL